MNAITQQFASFTAGLPAVFASSANASGIGQSFAQGIVNGITSGWIRAAAIAAAQAAKNAAQQALAINSPSKVGMQIGSYFGKGMALVSNCKINTHNI